MAKLCIQRLSSYTRTVLEEIARRSASGREVRRAQILLGLDAGETVADTAARLQVTRQMIYQVVARYQARRTLPIRARLQDAPHPGRPNTKRTLVQAALQDLLEQVPRDYGYPGQVWTTGMLQHQLAQHYDLRVSHDTVQRALHDLSYRYKRPRYVLARRAAHWRQAKGGLNAA